MLDEAHSYRNSLLNRRPGRVVLPKGQSKQRVCTDRRKVAGKVDRTCFARLVVVNACEGPVALTWLRPTPITVLRTKGAGGRQRPGGRGAKVVRGTTAEEFSHVMLTAVLPRIRAAVRKWPKVFPRGMADVKLCMDRAPWHQKAVRMGLLHDMGLTSGQLLPHPPGSPDFQAPVEWSHSWLNTATRKYLEDHPRVKDHAAIRRAMEKLFYGDARVGGEATVAVKKVAGAFNRLRENYGSVLASGGNYGSLRAT
ncbi:hypothetical protein PLESTM_001051500 [Pleodorina starrii]|nr:hypothetical protein PLESTM_001051500 [Pleodorina starrii]